ncbi:MAG: D-alanine--D-alanine ligase [Phycisphaerales bacterium JB043]
MDDRVRVIVLGGGPDAEREVSLASARNVAGALRESARFDVREHTIEVCTIEDLRSMEGDVFFPVLHGPWGEGGTLQELLESDGRPFVGAGASPSRLAMDKEATKALALRLGISTPDAVRFDPACETCPLPLPVIVKPNAEGSTIGMHICTTPSQWREAFRRTCERGVAALVERYVEGHELTVGVLCGEPLSIVEIVPAEGWYDYDAKYARDDTEYIVAPALGDELDAMIREDSLRIARHIGCDSLARVDWMLSEQGVPMLLEVNTIPGFTSHSLLPMAGAHDGMPMPDLCERLVDEAFRCRGVEMPRRDEAVIV